MTRAARARSIPGKRTGPGRNADGAQAEPRRSSALERPLDSTPARDDVPQSQAANVVPMSPTAPHAEVANTKVPAKATSPTSTANIDAKAERTAQVARIESALMNRYVIKRAPVTVGDLTIGRTEYRFRGDTSRVAFTESTFKLATDANSPSVARSTDARRGKPNSRLPTNLRRR